MTLKLLAALLAIALPLALSGCARGEAPRAADIVAPTQAFSDFGDLRVHYNVMPTLTLPEAMAREYGVAKAADTALVFVALRRLVDGEEQAAQGEVAGRALDLQGKRQQVRFSNVEIGEYTDHIGTIEVSPRDSYRFELDVRADGRTHVVRFQRNF
jgi:hypothetical protein